MFFLLYLPLPFYLFGLMTSFNSELYVGIMEEFLEKNNPIDSLTILMFTTVTYINGPLQNVVVASAFPSFPRLKWWKRSRNLIGLAISYWLLLTDGFILHRAPDTSPFLQLPETAGRLPPSFPGFCPQFHPLLLLHLHSLLLADKLYRNSLVY